MASNNKVISNFIWRFAERCGAQGVSFIVSIVLARILVPDVYGTVALVTVFTRILNVFIDSGMATALIQKKDTDDIDFSSVFYFNLCMCLVLYAVMFFSAPYIANFYNDESLTPIVRVLSLTLVISGIKNVQQAYISKTMQFKRFFFATLGGTIGAAIVGIAVAVMGGGVWALVVQQLFNATTDTAILWITVKWRPKLAFSFNRLKVLLSFGWKILASGLLDTVYNNIRQLLIGKLYSSADLGFFNQGKRFPELIVMNVNTSIDSVLLPVMSKEQDHVFRIKAMTRRAIKTSIYIMAPLMIGLACCADNVIKLVLTDKWLPAVPYLQIFCISYLFYPIHTANLNAIKAMGRSDILLKLEMQKKIAGIIILLLVLKKGVLAIALSLLISTGISMVINARPNAKLLSYSLLEQLQDIIPSILMAVFMGGIVRLVSIFNFPVVITLITQVLFGGVLYLGMSIVFKIETFMFLKEKIRNTRHFC